MNGGFFVLDPASGAPGDPAGVGVYDGRLLSEPIRHRPALVLHDDARGTQVRRFTWKGQGTGWLAAMLVDVVRGDRVRVDTSLWTGGAHRQRLRKDTTIVNGGRRWCGTVPSTSRNDVDGRTTDDLGLSIPEAATWPGRWAWSTR